MALRLTFCALRPLLGHRAPLPRRAPSSWASSTLEVACVAKKEKKDNSGAKKRFRSEEPFWEMKKSFIFKASA